MTHRRSVFLDALGKDAKRLNPEVYEYVAGPCIAPDSVNPHGVGNGVFEVAGSKFGFLMGLLRPFIGPELLVTRHEREVLFEIVNTPSVNEKGSIELAATRTFFFSTGPQHFRDVLVAGPGPGLLLNHLGSSKRLTMVLECSVSGQGYLILRSLSAHLRIGRTRVKLPRIFGIIAYVEDGYDTERQRRTVDVTVRNPIVGVVMHYRGWFTYRYLNEGSTT